MIFYRVKPGVVTCKLRELLANKEYVVTIQAMTAQIHYDLKQSSASVSFKTPEGGMHQYRVYLSIDELIALHYMFFL